MGTPLTMIAAGSRDCTTRRPCASKATAVGWPLFEPGPVGGGEHGGMPPSGTVGWSKVRG